MQKNKPNAKCFKGSTIRRENNFFVEKKKPTNSLGYNLHIYLRGNLPVPGVWKGIVIGRDSLPLYRSKRWEIFFLSTRICCLWSRQYFSGLLRGVMIRMLVDIDSTK